jgi:hypothetical protein
MLASTRMNLSKAAALVIDDNPQALELICSVLTGVRARPRRWSFASARPST